MKNDDMDARLKRLMAEMPCESVPDGFADSVMASLKPRKIRLLERALLWLRTPHSIRITPIRAIPALAAVLVLFVLALPMQRTVQTQDENLVPVRFVLGSAEGASEVAVIGSFNGWTPEGARMHYDKTLGAWVADMQLPPGVHEYVFLLDGKKVVSDPAAPLSRDDGFGNKNSVLYLTEDDEQIL